MHPMPLRCFAGLLVGVAVAALGGCLGGGQTRHFQIDMTPAMDPAPPLNIEIDRLTVADPLVRSEIMVQASPTEVRYLADALWTASMTELVHEKLSVEFGPLLPERQTVLVSGRIRHCGRLEEGAQAFAHVRLDLALRHAGTARHASPSHQRTYEIKRPLADDSPSTLVTELSRALEAAAADIASDAAALPSPERTS